METRIGKSSLLLTKYKGAIVTKEMLFGRGYFKINYDECIIENGFIRFDDIYPDKADNRILHFINEEDPDLYDEDEQECDNGEDEDDENEISCDDVKRYIAGNHEFRIGLQYLLPEKSQYWVKCIPAEPEDVDNREVDMAIIVATQSDGTDYIIQGVAVFARFVRQIGNGWFSIPGKALIDSDFSQMSFIPPEPFKEIEMLVKGRYIPEGFTLIGKPAPSALGNMWPAKNSGWRNIYWHITADCNEDNVIIDIDLSFYERETSMFQRPHSMGGDSQDAFDAILYFCDHYTDEEWQDLL